MKKAFYFKPQETEKIELLSQGTDDYQNLRSKTFVIADYNHVKFQLLLVTYRKDGRKI